MTSRLLGVAWWCAVGLGWIAMHVGAVAMLPRRFDTPAELLLQSTVLGMLVAAPALAIAACTVPRRLRRASPTAVGFGATAAILGLASMVVMAAQGGAGLGAAAGPWWLGAALATSGAAAIALRTRPRPAGERRRR